MFAGLGLAIASEWIVRARAEIRRGEVRIRRLVAAAGRSVGRFPDRSPGERKGARLCELYRGADVKRESRFLALTGSNNAHSRGSSEAHAGHSQSPLAIAHWPPKGQRPVRIDAPPKWQPIYREGARPAEDQRHQASKIEKVGLVSWLPEVSAGSIDR